MIKSNLSDRRPRREKFKKVITLVSGGFAAPTAFPEGKITVFPWDSTIDAWLTESAGKVNNSATRDRLLYEAMEKVCDLNGCALEDFVIGDVNTVLLTARSIPNGCRINYTTVCPKCAQEESDEIAVPDELKPIGQKATDYKGTDSIILKDSRDAVEARPLRIRDVLAIDGRDHEAKKRLSDHVAHVIGPIVTVGGEKPDKIEELLEWYMALSPADASQLEKFIDETTPHMSQDLPHSCDKCGHGWMHRLVLDQEFFRTGRMGTTGAALAASI